MSKRWFTSDTHYGHRNVIKYCNRPYKDIDEMHAAMIEQWNKQVAPTDHVYHLGDFSLNPKWSKLIVPMLNGTKELISGNHDATFPFPWNRKQVKMVQRYVEDGWKAVHQQLKLTLKDGTNVLLSHLPYAPRGDKDRNNDVRYLEFRPKDQGMILLHGHLHKRYKKLGRMIDVGFDGGLKLLSEDDILDLIHSKEEFIPSEITNWYGSKPSQGKDGPG